MTIKEVEALTGLTAKSIRLYEAKGLLTVTRKDGSSYREYSQSNLEQLKQIKLLRYLGLSIDEIRQLQSTPPEQAASWLRKKADALQNTIEDTENKRDLLLRLSRDMNKGAIDTDKYIGTIDFWESDDGVALLDSLREASIPTLPACIFSSIILLGPIGGLFINLLLGKQETLPLVFLLALLSTVFLTLQWRKYFAERKHSKKRAHTVAKKQWLLFPAAVGAVALELGTLILGSLIAEQVLAPEGWLFYEVSNVAVICMVYLLTAALYAATALLMARQKSFRETALCLGILSLVWIGITYCCVTNVTFVTEQSVVVCTPLHPQGTVYSYEEISQVEASFGGSSFSFLPYDRKGEFSYRITLDGRTIVFSAPSPNEDIESYSSDPWLALEDFDRRLMALGIPKHSSDAYSAYSSLDPEYIERFLQIIHNR